MRNENILLILWIIFGFLFITAIDSILYLIIHLIYFGLSELRVSFNLMRVIIPITTLILYGLTTFVLLKRINVKSKISGIYLTEFPKKLTIILGVIAFGLSPVTEKLRALYAENISENKNIEMAEYMDFYGWFYTGLGISQLLVMLTLLIFFLTKLETVNKN